MEYYAVRNGFGYQKGQLIGSMTFMGQLVLEMIESDSILTRNNFDLLPDTFLLRDRDGVPLTVWDIKKSLRQEVSKNAQHHDRYPSVVVQFPVSVGSGSFYPEFPTPESVTLIHCNRLAYYLVSWKEPCHIEMVSAQSNQAKHSVTYKVTGMSLRQYRGRDDTVVDTYGHLEFASTVILNRSDYQLIEITTDMKGLETLKPDKYGNLRDAEGGVPVRRV